MNINWSGCACAGACVWWKESRQLTFYCSLLLWPSFGAAVSSITSITPNDVIVGAGNFSWQEFETKLRRKECEMERMRKWKRKGQHRQSPSHTISWCVSFFIFAAQIEVFDVLRKNFVFVLYLFTKKGHTTKKYIYCEKKYYNNNNNNNLQSNWNSIVCGRRAEEYQGPE